MTNSLPSVLKYGKKKTKYNEDNYILDIPKNEKRVSAPT